jgi:hypothetical protein
MQRRHIYYVPGYISLVLFPLFCLLFLWQHGAFNEFHVIPMYWNREDAYGKNFLVAHPARHFRDIHITGDDATDSETFSRIQSDLKNLTVNCDTVSGLRIQLGPNTRYQALIRVMDMLLDYRTYHTSEKGIWIWYEIPDTTPALHFMNICGTGVIEAEMQAKNLQKQERAELASKILSIIKSLWPCVLLWAILAIRSVRRSFY